MAAIPKHLKPLNNAEIKDLLGATLHGPLPVQTMSRVFSSLSELSELRDAAEDMLKNCQPCAGTGRVSSNFNGDNPKECVACRKLRAWWRNWQ
jgi:hypothetical protein